MSLSTVLPTASLLAIVVVMVSVPRHRLHADAQQSLGFPSVGSFPTLPVGSFPTASSSGFGTLPTFNPQQIYQYSYGDQHTTGSILQSAGGTLRRNDGRESFFSNYNAYNNPSAYPRHTGFPGFPAPSFQAPSFQAPSFTAPSLPSFTAPSSAGFLGRK